MDKEIKLSVIEKFNLYELTEDDVDSLLIIYPDNDLLVGLKAFFLIENCQLAEANAFLQNCLHRSPVLEHSTFFNWIKAYYSLDKNQYEYYLHFLKKSYDLDHNFVNPFVRLELYYSDVFNENAKSYLHESLKISENYIDAMIAIGYDLETHEMYQEALTQYEKILEKKELPVIYNAIGNVHLTNRNYFESEKAFEKSLSINENIDALIGLGDIHFSKGQIQTAIEFFNRAKEKNDCQGIALSRLAFCHIELENVSEAIDFFNAAYKKFPSEENLINKVYGCLIDEDIIKSSQVLEKYKSDFGESHKSILFEIIILGKKGEIQKAQMKIDYLYQNFLEEKIQWVINRLEKWGVKITSSED